MISILRIRNSRFFRDSRLLFGSRQTSPPFATLCKAHHELRTRGSSTLVFDRRNNRTDARCADACKRGLTIHIIIFIPFSFPPNRIVQAVSTYSANITSYRKCDWISISRRSWCSTPAFCSCDLNKTWYKWTVKVTTGDFRMVLGPRFQLTFNARMNLLCFSLAR